MMTLGPFSYSMMSFALLLIRSDDWDFAIRRFSWKRERISVAYDPTDVRQHRAARWLARLDLRNKFVFADSRESPASADRARPKLYSLLSALPLGFFDSDTERASNDAPVARVKTSMQRGIGEGLASVLLATLAVQVATDNWIIPDPYRVKKRPQVMREIVDYLRLPQGWSMFSPEAPKEDGTVVIDAILSDGRHIDPRKQLPPDFEAAFHGPWFDDQQWCDWDLRMKFDTNRHFTGYFREYIDRLDELDSWRQKATIKYFEVYWVNNNAPAPGSTTPYNIQKLLLFNGGVKP